MSIQEIPKIGRDYASQWVLHLQPDGAILVDKASLYYVRLSSLAAELLLQYSRARSPKQVVATRAIIDNEPPSQVQKLLGQVLGLHPLTEQWLQGGVDSSISVTGSSQTFLPLSVTLQLTNGCNLTCPFCYASSGLKRDKELSPGQWVDVIERLTTRGAISVTLTGGEPTLVEGFREILAAASGLSTLTAVFTNGYSWSNQNRELVAALGNVDIQISIDGTALTHDLIRGRSNAFDRALETIDWFSQHGVTVDVAMTATPQNFKEVYGVADAVDRSGASLLRVGQVQNLGRAHDDEQYGLTTKQRTEINAQLEKFEAENRALVVYPWATCNGPEDLLDDTGFTAEFLVPGYLAWYVLSNGNVTPCQLEEASILGDICTETVEYLGHPDRLSNAAGYAQGCTCMRRVKRPSTADLPFVREK